MLYMLYAFNPNHKEFNVSCTLKIKEPRKNELSIKCGGTSNFNRFHTGINGCDFFEKWLVEAISPSYMIHDYLMSERGYILGFMAVI